LPSRWGPISQTVNLLYKVKRHYALAGGGHWVVLLSGQGTIGENIRIALNFQREVIHRLIPEVQPDLVHCYDWITGLIKAMARSVGVPSISTLYRLDSPRLPSRRAATPPFFYSSASTFKCHKALPDVCGDPAASLK
jgi:Starch synthase catalytic domain